MSNESKKKAKEDSPDDIRRERIRILQKKVKLFDSSHTILVRVEVVVAVLTIFFFLFVITKNVMYGAFDVAQASLSIAGSLCLGGAFTHVRKLKEDTWQKLNETQKELNREEDEEREALKEEEEERKTRRRRTKPRKPSDKKEPENPEDDK